MPALHADKKEDIWPAFVITEEDAPIKWLAGVIFCPVYINIPEGSFIIEIAFGGKIGILEEMAENNVIGFRFDKYMGIHLNSSNQGPTELFTLSEFPLILINGKKAIEIRELQNNSFHIIEVSMDLGISYSFINNE